MKKYTPAQPILPYLALRYLSPNLFIRYKRSRGVEGAGGLSDATRETLHSRHDAKGAEICLFDYPRGLHPSCSDNFVHLRLNPFEQGSRVVVAGGHVERVTGEEVEWGERRREGRRSPARR